MTEASLEVQLILPTENRIISVELSETMTPSEIISELTAASLLPLDIGYYSIAQKGGEVLDSRISLYESGIQDKSVLRVIPTTDAG